MRSRRFFPVVLTLVAPAALGLVAGCGSSTPSAVAASASPTASSSAAASSRGPLTLDLVERPTSTTFTPKGGTTTQGSPTRQPGPGDVIAFDSALTRDGAAFGHDHVTFTYGNDGRALIQADLVLPDGTIDVRGTAPVLETLTVPVVSTTGGYAGRTGSLTAKHVSDQAAELTVTLR